MACRTNSERQRLLNQYCFFRGKVPSRDRFHSPVIGIEEVAVGTMKLYGCHITIAEVHEFNHNFASLNMFHCWHFCFLTTRRRSVYSRFYLSVVACVVGVLRPELEDPTSSGCGTTIGQAFRIHCGMEC